MATSFREVFITFALIGVFVFAAISFIVTTQLDNDVDDTILEDEFISQAWTQMNRTLGDFSSNATTQKDNFELEHPERGFGSLIIFAIVGAGKGFTGMIMGVYHVVIVLPAAVLNLPPIVVSVLTAILVMSLILLIWKLYRSGV